MAHYGETPYMHYDTLWRNPLHALWHTMEEPPTCTMAHYGGTPYMHYGTLWRNPYMHYYGTLWNPLHALLWHTMEEPPTCTMVHVIEESTLHNMNGSFLKSCTQNINMSILVRIHVNYMNFKINSLKRPYAECTMAHYGGTPKCTMAHYGGTPYMHYDTLWRNPLHSLWHTMEEPLACTMGHYGGTPYMHYGTLWRNPLHAL